MMMLLLAVFTIFGAATAAIPDYLSPVSYDLSFTLDLDNPKTGFTGTSNMVFVTSSDLSRGIMSVVLSSLDLKITSAVIRYPDTKQVSVKNIIYNRTTETVELHSDQELSPNSKYTLELEYTGLLNGTQGLFVSQVGTENYLGTSTYPVYAKRVYPCFDKPNLRAKYTLSLSILYSRKNEPTIVTGLSGSYKAMKDNKNHYLSGTYTSDIDLPPYGLFFTAGSYKKLQDKYSLYLPYDTNNLNDDLVDTLVSTVVTDLSKNAGFDLKMVIVPGLPAPSASGYGIVAVSPNVGLTEPDDPTALQREKALEIFKGAIMSCFATVVSPSSWENIWLAESTSAYIAHAAINQLTTNWKNWPNVEITALQQFAMSNSWSFDSSPVIPNKLNSSEEVIKFISDPAIIKGSAVLATVETIAKSSAGFTSFIAFINEFKGKAVSTEDFLNFYEQSNNMNHTLPDGKTLVALVKPWLTQTGYPYLTVFRSDHQVDINKKRFITPDNSHSGWTLPLTYKTFYLNNTNNTNLLQSDVVYVWLSDEENGNYTIAKDSSHNLLVVCNIEGPGAYRVLYDSSSLKYISNGLKADVNYLGDQSLRSTILSDNFAFVQNGLITYSSLFDTLRYLTGERSLGPWVVASRGLRQFWSLMYFSDLRLPFQNYVTHLMRATYQQYGIDANNPDSMLGILRSEIISSMCDYGDEACRKDTKNAYNTYIVKKESIANVDIIEQLYCNGLRDVLDGQIIRQMLKDSYQETMGQYQKKSLFSYLACSGGEYSATDAIANLLEDVLLSSTYQVTMPGEDMFLAFKEIADKPQHYVQALKYFTQQFTNIRSTLNIEQRAELIRYLGNLGSTDEHLVVFGNFTYSNSSDILSAVQDAISSVKARKQFLGQHYNDIYEGLYGYLPGPPTPSPPVTPTTGPTKPPTKAPPTKPTPANGSPASAAIVPALLASSFLALRYLV